MTALVEAQGVARFYGQVVGLSDLDLTLQPGVIGLIGPNGAGKSTLLKLIAGELRPSRGELRVLGLEPFANRVFAQKLGFAPQQDAFYEDMSALAFVSLCMRAHGFGVREARVRGERALERVGLTEVLGRRLSSCSKGMRQRVKIAQAIGHEPELLVLDEPLNGLDPRVRHSTLELFAELAQGGTSVLLSSHVLHEVEHLTDSVALIHRGRLLAEGRVQDIRELIDSRPRRLTVELDLARPLAAELIAREDVPRVSIQAGPDGPLLDIQTDNLAGVLEHLGTYLASHPGNVRRLSPSDESLEAVFDDLVG